MPFASANLLAQRSCPASMAEIEVEAIFKSIQELQTERLQNEKYLAEETAKRKEIESTLEAVMLRYSVVSEKHSKISEAVRVAEQKVAHAQSCAMKYEQLNQEKREKISELSKSIKMEEDKRTSQLAVFEQQMKELTDKFRNSRHFYAEQSLENHITACEEQTKLKQSQVETQERQKQELLATIEQLNEALMTETISEDTWQTVMYETSIVGNSASVTTRV